MIVRGDPCVYVRDEPCALASDEPLGGEWALRRVVRVSPAQETVRAGADVRGWRPGEELPGDAGSDAVGAGGAGKAKGTEWGGAARPETGAAGVAAVVVPLVVRVPCLTPELTMHVVS